MPHSSRLGVQLGLDLFLLIGLCTPALFSVMTHRSGKRVRSLPRSVSSAHLSARTLVTGGTEAALTEHLLSAGRCDTLEGSGRRWPRTSAPIPKCPQRPSSKMTEALFVTVEPSGDRLKWMGPVCEFSMAAEPRAY